jgi:hypothetical protein
MLLIDDEAWKVDLTAWFQNDGEIHAADFASTGGAFEDNSFHIAPITATAIKFS